MTRSMKLSSHDDLLHSILNRGTQRPNSLNHPSQKLKPKNISSDRAVRYDDIYRMDEIKSISFHIMFYRLYRGVAKYIVSCNTFSSFE